MSVAILGGPRLGAHEGYHPVGDGWGYIRRIWRNTSDYSSASDWAPIVHAALVGIRDTCSQAGWDGEDAVAISDHVIEVVAQIAACLFTMLPRGTPAPDVIPESDGDICLSWMVDSDRVFSLSIGAQGKMNFAGRFGREGALHAWQTINRYSLEDSLQDIARYIERLYPAAALRRAA